MALFVFPYEFLTEALLVSLSFSRPLTTSLHSPRPCSVCNTLEALLDLAEFLKSLVSVGHILKALQLRAEFLKFPTFVFNFPRPCAFLPSLPRTSS